MRVKTQNSIGKRLRKPCLGTSSHYKSNVKYQNSLAIDDVDNFVVICEQEKNYWRMTMAARKKSFTILMSREQFKIFPFFNLCGLSFKHTLATQVRLFNLFGLPYKHSRYDGYSRLVGICRGMYLGKRHASRCACHTYRKFAWSGANLLTWPRC